MNTRTLRRAAVGSAWIEVEDGPDGLPLVTGKPDAVDGDGGSARSGLTDHSRSARWILFRVNGDREAREIEDHICDLRSGTSIRWRRLPRDTPRVRVGLHPLSRASAWSHALGRTGAHR
jgi:hypothetical protein